MFVWIRLDGVVAVSKTITSRVGEHARSVDPRLLLSERQRGLRARKEQLELDELEHTFRCCVCHVQGEEFEELIQGSQPDIFVPLDATTVSASGDGEGIESQPSALMELVTLGQDRRTGRRRTRKRRDGGLQRIHESEIEAFSVIFGRPVRGFLCKVCHAAVQFLLEGIKTKVSDALQISSHHQTSNLATRTVSQFVHESLYGKDTAEQVSNAEPSLLSAQDESEELSPWLVEQVRTTRCAICRIRSACYFYRKAAVLICSICCIRDREYRIAAEAVAPGRSVSKESAELLLSIFRPRKCLPESRSSEKSFVQHRDLFFNNGDTIDLFANEMKVDRLCSGPTPVAHHLSRADFSDRLRRSQTTVDGRQLLRNTTTDLFRDRQFVKADEDLFGVVWAPQSIVATQECVEESLVRPKTPVLFSSDSAREDVEECEGA